MMAGADADKKEKVRNDYCTCAQKSRRQHVHCVIENDVAVVRDELSIYERTHDQEQKAKYGRCRSQRSKQRAGEFRPGADFPRRNENWPRCPYCHDHRYSPKANIHHRLHRLIRDEHKLRCAPNDERSHAGPKTLKCNRDRLPALAAAACYLDHSQQLSERLRKRSRGGLVQNDLRVAVLLG